MTTDAGYTGYATTGAKYEHSRYVTATEIAKNIRADIKAAIQAGALPSKLEGFKYSVRSESYAGGQSVSIHILGPINGGSDTAWAMRPVTDSQEDAHAVAMRIEHVFTDDAKRIGKTLREIGNAYTHRDVDSQIDYFDVSCYISVYVGSGGLCL